VTPAPIDPTAALGLGWTIFLSVISAIVGGVATGVILGMFFGSLKARLDQVENTLADVSERLKAGDERFDSLVELAEKARVLGRELDAMSNSLGNVVSKELCGERHRVGLNLMEAAGKVTEALNRVAGSIEKATAIWRTQGSED